MSSFNQSENDEIYRACRLIRTLMVAKASVHGIKHPGDSAANITITKIITDAGVDGSKIHTLIEDKKWKELFIEKDWLSLIEGAANLNPLCNGVMTESLETIAKYFPNETSGVLVPDLIQ